eukprot:2012219-Amphidinium_carterae.1
MAIPTDGTTLSMLRKDQDGKVFNFKARSYRFAGDTAVVVSPLNNSLRTLGGFKCLTCLQRIGLQNMSASS